MDSAVAHRRILLISKPGTDGEAIARNLAQDGEVSTVQTYQEALDALRHGDYRWVVCQEGDYLALERGAVSHQAAMILETIGQGVCIVDRTGRPVWSNPKMKAYPTDLIGKVCDACVRAFGDANDADKGMPAHHRARRVSLAAGQDQHFDVTITPVVNSADEIVQIAAVVWDVTHTRRLQKKLDAIERAGRDLVQIDVETIAGMDIEARISMLEQKMLGYMHDLLHFDNFVVLLIDKKTSRMEVVLQHGMSERMQGLDLFANPDDNGISGYVATTGRSYICADTSQDPRYLPGLERARSSLTVPLRLHDKIIGVFDIESERLGAFNEDDRQFAEILARHLAVALNILDLLVTERYTSTGQLADDVSGEIAGPLNDIISDATTLMEEYIGHDDLRRRLSAICDNVSEIKGAIKSVAAPRSGVLGRQAEPRVADPLLVGKRVLVADDEEIIRETIAGVLRKHGCEVETACDGNQAVAMLERRRYDLVLADIKMPNRNGYEVFAAARDRPDATPVILMTGFGYDPNHSIVRARREGLSAVLFKPFKVDQLLEEIRVALQPRA